MIMNIQHSDEGRFLLSRRETVTKYCVRSHVMCRVRKGPLPQGYAKIPRRVPTRQILRFWHTQVPAYACLFRPEGISQSVVLLYL